ncbi:hypothetical protein ACFLYH_03480, partial [Candidatus Dependentiae bacterium]
DFDKKYLDKFFNFELTKYEKMIKSSHFYDNENKRDLTIKEISKISKVLSPVGCGNILFSDFKFGIFLGSTIITFSFDKKFGDIVINFNMDSIFEDKKTKVIDNLKKVLEKAISIKKEYLIPVIFFGVEPAEDKDTCLLKLDDNVNINLHQIIKQILSSVEK